MRSLQVRVASQPTAHVTPGAPAAEPSPSRHARPRRCDPTSGRYPGHDQRGGESERGRGNACGGRGWAWLCGQARVTFSNKSKLDLVPEPPSKSVLPVPWCCVVA